MNIKLKSIELDSFRAYKNKQLFDFTTEKGDIANLVVIFAPNGYGKTSFLDAVEWGLNKEINRFSNNGVLKKIAKREKEVILKNRDSNSSHGAVKFIDDRGDALVINTQVRGRKYRSDYNDGIVIEESSQLILLRSSISAKDNILSHDKIDSFLLVSSGSDRYEALAKFWDYSKDTENYKTIFSLWNHIKKEIDNRKKYLNKIIKDIKEIHLPIEDINLIIQKINEFNIHEVYSENISNELTEKELKELVNNIINKKSKILKEEENLQNNYNSICQLYENYDGFKEKVNLQIELDARKKEIVKRIDKYKFKDVLNKQNDELHKQYNLVLKELNMIETLKQKGPSYLQAKIIIDEMKTVAIENNKSINILESKNNLLSTEKLGIQFIIDKENDELIKSSKERKVLNRKIEEFKNLYTALKKQEKRMVRLNNIVNIISDKNQTLLNKFTELDLLLNSDKALLNYEFKNSSYVKTVNLLRKYILSITQKKEQKRIKEKEYEQLGRLNDDLITIKKLGRNLIVSSGTEECPLCSTSFSDIKDLISQVEKNMDDVYKIKLINHEIRELDKEIEELNLAFDKLLNDLKINLKEDFKKTQDKRKVESDKLTRVNLILERIVRQERNIKNQLEELTLYFKNFNVNKDTFERDTKVINMTLEKNIKEKTLLIESEKRKVSFVKEQFNKNKELILSLERVNIEKSAISMHLEAEPDYQMILNILNTLDLDISFDINQILDKENGLEKQSNIIREKINKVKLSLQEINIDEQEYDLFTLQVALQNINNDGNINKEFIDKYIFNSKKYLQSNEVNKNIFEITLKRINNSMNQIQNLISYFELLYEKLQYTSEVLENSAKVKEKNLLIIELEKLKRVELQVNESLKASQRIIIGKINKAFNLNIINMIYGRIEPHPELNFMEIIPNFLEDKPSLEIYAPMGKERKDNPIIFFSSAQLDILSLSIFFAKALMEPRPLLNTIFIDDPVHHMDSVNVLSFIDLLRTLTVDFDRQIVITTHNENLFRLIEQKMNPSYCSSKFIQLDSHGKINKE